MSVDTYLATLRDWIGDPEDYSDEDRGAAERACDACDGVEAELSRLRELCVAIDTGTFDTQRERAEAAEAELSRLREQRDYDVWNERILRRAAEARCARLQQALMRLREMLYDATITYSSFCDKCGPMDDSDPADPKYLGSPMMTETLPLREVVEEALAGPEGRTERERYVLSCLRSSLDRYEARRERLEQLGSERLARKHVSRGVAGFTYHPTPPSGPAPKDGPSGRSDRQEDKT